MLAHADDIGHHDPVVAVDEGEVEPLGQLGGVDAALQRPGPQHHQPRDVVGPALVAHLPQHAAQAAGRHCVGVEVPEPVRHPLVGIEGVAPAVGRTLVPVGVPHVVAPPDQLPHEALDGLQGRQPVVQRLFGRPHALHRVEQPEVQRRRQQAVAHRGVAGEHRILVGPEGCQPVSHEVVEQLQGLGPRGGEPAR